LFGFMVRLVTGADADRSEAGGGSRRSGRRRRRKSAGKNGGGYEEEKEWAEYEDKGSTGLEYSLPRRSGASSVNGSAASSVSSGWSGACEDWERRKSYTCEKSYTPSSGSDYRDSLSQLSEEARCVYIYVIRCPQLFR
jgi:hypothetical protein